jgi:antibiotic biosynthesis monooxygenase (ABM) superfamily enzyme
VPDAKSVAIVRHTEVPLEATEAYAMWRSRLITALGATEGFVRMEAYPPDESQPDWVTIERFTSVAAAQEWLRSDIRAQLAAEVADFVSGTDSVTMLVGEDPGQAREVTAVITNSVKPGCQEEFKDWMRRIHNVQSRYPGYRGVQVQPPIEGVSADWVTLLRFDTAENLRGWMGSQECASLEAESRAFLNRGVYRVARTTFANWLPADEQAAEPALWKVNAIVLLVLYPVVMLEIIFLYPRIAFLGNGLMTFVGNAISVAITGFLLVPWAAGWFRKWLSPPTRLARRWTIVGSLVVLALYAALIAAMSALGSAVSG